VAKISKINFFTGSTEKGLAIKPGSPVGDSGFIASQGCAAKPQPKGDWLAK
jgi:hypothetical protein